jgi:uncharacterized membrane protein YhaH (DUF805 family)
MKKYFYSDGKEKQGPFSYEELRNENINKDTLIWFEGLEDWIPAKNIKELEEILQLIPPSIPINEIESNSDDKESKEKVEDSVFDKENHKNDSKSKPGMFSNSFSFEGRIRRTEYGISLIVYVIISTIINLILESSTDAAILVLGYIPMLWFLWAQGAKRCHDMGKIGWYQIIPFYVLWMLFFQGEAGFINQYGRNPKM